MPAERLPMRQVREVLRLKYLCGQSGHRIAAAIGISRYTVAEYLRRAAVRRVPVTLLLLWEEYRAGQPDRYGYSRFCDLYAVWRGRLSPTMRQSHPVGERLFVDYAGQTVVVIDAISGDGADLDCRAGRLEPDLCRGSLDAGAGRPDRLPRQRLRLPRRRHAPGGVRQPQGGRHRGLSLRTIGQPHLRGHGIALQLAVLPLRRRMGIVEADKPLPIRAVQRQRVVPPVRLLRRRRNPRHHEPDPMATLRVHDEHLASRSSSTPRVESRGSVTE
jgi:hypothetical protein